MRRSLARELHESGRPAGAGRAGKLSIGECLVAPPRAAALDAAADPCCRAGRPPGGTAVPVGQDGGALLLCVCGGGGGGGGGRSLCHTLGATPSGVGRPARRRASDVGRRAGPGGMVHRRCRSPTLHLTAALHAHAACRRCVRRCLRLLWRKDNGWSKLGRPPPPPPAQPRPPCPSTPLPRRSQYKL